MLASRVFDFKLKRQPATMQVFRNNGACWGRLVVNGEQFDVPTRADHYDDEDFVAAEAFIRAARRGKYEPAVGWL